MSKSSYGRQCAVCGGPLGPQCFGGVWSRDWNDFMDGKIEAFEIRESCQFCYAVGEPPFMWGKEVHDAILKHRSRKCEDHVSK